MGPLPLLPGCPSSSAATPLDVAVPAAALAVDLPCAVCPLQQQLRDAQWQAAYYKAQHRRAVAREQQLKDERDQLQAQIRDLRHRLFGRTSESHDDADQAARAADAAAQEAPDAAGQRPRRRGQRHGAKGHGRRTYDHLPTVEEVSDLPEAQRCCEHCGLPFDPFPGSDDTTVLEIEVKAHRRLVHRRRYRPRCDCDGNPGIVTAPPPPRLIPKSPFGVSIWVELLLDKYLFYRPTHRLLADWRSRGLDVAAGSLTGGLRQLLPLFEPLYEALIKRSQQQVLWHGDETRWLVFQSIDGKVGYHWYLWVFHADEAVVFVLAAGRGHDVPEEHFRPVTQEAILVVDRYAAYPAIDKVKAGQITLALCWAHQRRDFLEVGRSWPAHQEWAFAWRERIGHLYHLNERRLELREDSEGFEQRDQDLRQAVAAMAGQAEQELSQANLHPARRKVLESLGEHWTGLTVFVEHPEVPMDNNTAERAERGPVVGRKNYYGSGAVWAGRLAAMLFSLFATLERWQINSRAWLSWYLNACAEAGGQVPADLSSCLPWNLSEQQRDRLQLDPKTPTHTSNSQDKADTS
jgi:transposase